MAHLRVDRAGQRRHADLAGRIPIRPKSCRPNQSSSLAIIAAIFSIIWSKEHGREGIAAASQRILLGRVGNRDAAAVNRRARSSAARTTVSASIGAGNRPLEESRGVALIRPSE